MKHIKILLAIAYLLVGFTGFSQTQNNALNFDGTDDYVAIPHNVALDFSRGFTVEAWVYPESNDSAFFSKGYTNTVNGFLLEVYSSGNFSFYLTSRNSWSILRSSTKVPLNAWVHLAATYDNSTMKVYVNGVLRGSRSSSIIVGNSNSAVDLGRFDDILDGDNNLDLDGSLDEVRVWDKVLTAEEILAQKDCKMPANTPGLVAYYDFNQGTANGGNNAIATLTDIGGNGLSGTLTNFAKTGNTSNFVSGVTGAFNNEACVTFQSASYNGDTQKLMIIFDEGDIMEINESDVILKNAGTGVFQISSFGFTINPDANSIEVIMPGFGHMFVIDNRNTVTLTIPAGIVSTASGVPNLASSGIQLDIVSTLGIDEDFELSGVSVSPNPTHGILNITTTEKADYSLFSITGKTLKKGTLAAGERKIDISYFAKGVYLLNLKTSKGSFTKKVVRE